MIQPECKMNKLQKDISDISVVKIKDSRSRLTSRISGAPLGRLGIGIFLPRYFISQL
ncbi:rCG63598 [Rattus norvegicus]|uniref:RCG63598 n=1 Tax=Rattus norvegicus TaxID=10116 RepID=A6JL54_RAT|nr:rCG63598 [Rattus norvegicus]